MTRLKFVGGPEPANKFTPALLKFPTKMSQATQTGNENRDRVENVLGRTGVLGRPGTKYILPETRVRGGVQRVTIPNYLTRLNGAADTVTAEVLEDVTPKSSTQIWSS